MGKKNSKSNWMPHEEYLKLRAQQVRDSAANAILSQNLPNVPALPAYETGWSGLISKTEGKLGVSDETRIKWHGYEPYPETCLYTTTSQYGDKDAKATANPDFKENHEKYGFVSIPMSEATVGDLLQFSKEKTPKHSAIYTGETKEEGIPLVSYSRGGVGETSLTPEGRLSTMVHNKPIQHVTSRIGIPIAFRYIGTPAKKQEWTDEWNNKYGTQRNNGRLGVTARWAEGGFMQPKDAWDKLSMYEKAEMMKVAVKNGIYNLSDIRQKYNEFAEGGSKVEEEEVNTNSFSSGGSIHIKPSHRGRLTELKKRTGKTEAELYRTGSAATRKMITFARNARKWKHGDGGNLFSGEEEGSQKMQIGLKVTNGWKPYTLDDILANAARIEQQKQAMEDKLNNVFTLSNDATSVANGRPQNRHLERKAVEGAKAHRAWEEEHPNITAWTELASTIPFGIAAYPFIVEAGVPALNAASDFVSTTTTGKTISSGLNAIANTSIKGIPAIKWADIGLTATAGSDGLQKMSEGNFTPMTIAEVLPTTRALGDGERWRQAVYRNMLPFSYNLPLKAAETIPTVLDYISMRPLNVSENTALPWQRFWGTVMGASDKSKFMGARRQAWAKNLKQPQNFEYPVYKTIGRNSDGMEVVEANIENIPFANGEKVTALTPKRMADETRKGISENRDRLLNNHRYMTITDLGGDNYHFYDIWDTQPFLRFGFLPEN